MIRRSWALALIAGLLGLAGCGPMGRGGPRCPDCNVVLISIDTLRADHLGSYGYPRATSPNIDELAESAILFERAYTQSTNTLVSHASMLTSLYPIVHRVNVEKPLAEDFTTLAEYFKGLGYATAGFAQHATWLNEKMGFAQGFDVFESEYSNAIQNNERVFEWLKNNSQQKFFLFVHYYDVHSDYRKLPYETRTEYDEKFVGDYQGSFTGCLEEACASRFLREIGPKKWPLSDEDLEYIVALYDGGIAFTDAQVGKLVDQLESLGVFGDTMLVVTSDHGEQFGEHGKMLHFEAYDEVARVPLIVRIPGRKQPRRIRSLVGTIDLVPTILDLVGATNENLQGRSLVPLIEGRSKEDRVVPSFLNTSKPSDSLDKYSSIFFRNGSYSFLTREGFTGLELYDVRVDPREQQDVAGEREVVARELLDESKRFFAQQLEEGERVDANAKRTTVTAEEEELLRSLGYLN